MKKILFLFTLTLVACSENVEKKLYTDPISNEKVVFEELRMGEWTIYNAEGSGLLMIKKNGTILASIIDTKDGREITIQSENEPFGAVSARDSDYDNNYEKIEYRNGSVSVTDLGLDGKIESILNYEQKNYI